jgi:hypothetical protein
MTVPIRVERCSYKDAIALLQALLKQFTAMSEFTNTQSFIHSDALHNAFSWS